MTSWIWNVQIECAGGDAYDASADALAALYGSLLGMQKYDIGYTKLTKGNDILPEIGFEGDGGAGNVRPRWPDPDHPAQVHLDIEVGDLDAAGTVALENGAVLLRAFDDHRVYADPAGHPFCLYPDPTLDPPLPGRMARVVIDCFSPRALAPFYEEILDMRTRVVDTPERVVIKGDLEELRVTDDAGRTFTASLDPRAPMLAFQHSTSAPPRWPDPTRPAQLHLDLGSSDRPAALQLMERLGALHLRDAVWADPVGHPHCT